MQAHHHIGALRKFLIAAHALASIAPKPFFPASFASAVLPATRGIAALLPAADTPSSPTNSTPLRATPAQTTQSAKSRTALVAQDAAAPDGRPKRWDSAAASLRGAHMSGPIAYVIAHRLSSVCPCGQTLCWFLVLHLSRLWFSQRKRHRPARHMPETWKSRNGGADRPPLRDTSLLACA